VAMLKPILVFISDEHGLSISSGIYRNLGIIQILHLLNPNSNVASQFMFGSRERAERKARKGCTHVFSPG
jgi:hypothetical protein